MAHTVYHIRNGIASTIKYHVFFAPKYRRKVFYGDKRLEIGQIWRRLCNWKGVNIINTEVCPDQVHIEGYTE